MKRIYIISVFVIISLNIMGQSPQAFRFQAIVHDNNGNLVIEENVSFQITIHESFASGPVVFQETHNVTTNKIGVANFFIGEGVVLVGEFISIDWGSNLFFLEVGYDFTGGSDFDQMSVTQMVSVPYAMYADSAGVANDNDWLLSDDNLIANNTGKIGIGTSDPGNLVHISGSDSNPLLYVEKTGSGRGLKVSTTTACALWVSNSGNHGLRITHANGNGINITNADGNGVHVVQAGGWAGYFDGTAYFSDNVGIGTLTPVDRLDVNGNIRADAPLNSDHVATKQYVDDLISEYQNKIESLEEEMKKLKGQNEKLLKTIK